MNNTLKLIIGALLLVAFIAGAAVMYDKFSEKYASDNLVITPQESVESGTGEETRAEQDPYPDAVAAPDFEVIDSDGNSVRLSDYVGRPIVLNFWATWCYYCKEEMPDFDRAYQKHPDVQFLMVNATDGVEETVSGAKAYVEKEGFSFDVFYDTRLEAVSVYAVTGFPQTFFIDGKGRLIARGNGMLDYETLERGISMIKEQG